MKRKLKSYLPTRTNSSALVATTVTINVILIGISRFTYIIVDRFFEAEGNFFGFKWLSTFFWNTGVEIFTVNMAFLMYYGTFFMQKKVVPLFRGVSYFVAATGFFFLSWIFFDNVGVTSTLEIYFSIATGLLATKIAFLMYGFTLAYLKGLKVSLSELINVIVNNVPEKYLGANMIEVYDEEIVWPALKFVNDETL